MKIVQTCQTKSWGGLEMQTVIISRALKNCGHEVVILCAPDSAIEKEASSLGITVAPLFTSKINRYFKISSFFRKFRPDIIHSHLSHDLGVVVPALFIAHLKTPLILTKRMGSDVKKKDLIHRFLYNRVNLVYTISNYIRTSVLETCPVKETKVKLLLNAIDLDKYHPEKFNQVEQRKKYQIPLDKTVVGFIGRLSWAKGIRELIEAAGTLSEKYPDLFFVFTGKATYTQEYMEQETRELAQKCLVKANYIFTGFEANVSEILPAFDILAFPSYKESFGNVVLEAMAMKVPVAASGSGGVPDMITHLETGLLFEPRNADSLANSLKLLVDDPSLREKIRTNARKHVEEHFRFENYIATLESDYRTLSQK
ncbi:MAG: hypothetical protein A2W91_13615 [Bacteroidetes bacterium GWF2_38_335]|nr:MAG: hypothetical protein A2W91_13615 [Bacteroidetes bacterium GWF2_38_335]OFY77288.1 MAG: hypothetical protein A2281_15280 [Bacteroidetes bacterium RIFOXYA12_FULL_38_20]HBS85707.1 hypothetical protein [Bacteroidales bacterium]